MKNKLIHISIIIIIILSVLTGLYFYNSMPAKMISHWNSAGQPDGYMNKFWGLFLMPMITLGVYLLFLFVPIIDPLKKNIDKFRGYFDWFILMMILFLFYIYLLSITANLGYQFNMTVMIVPAVGLLFIYIGYLLENAKRNWFIGIRTPWTLSSDKVWDKTHLLGGKLFKLAGLLVLLGLILNKYAIWILLVVTIWASLYPIIYSYFEYKKEK